MFQQKKAVTILSILMILLTFLATLGGILIPGIYQDNPTFVLIWQSNDFVTLLVALPLLITAMIVWGKTHSLKSLLVWFSVLWYLCYNYSFYVFGAAFNALYLFYLFIYSLSILTLVIGLTSLPISIIESAIKPKFARKLVIAEMLFVSAGLTMIYVMQSLAFVFNGALPAIITASGHVTSVVFAIDMSMVVIFFVLGSILLAKRNPWGYVLAFLGNFKGVLYMGVLTAGSLRTNPSEAPIWIVLGILSLGSLVLLWIGLKDLTAVNP